MRILKLALLSMTCFAFQANASLIDFTADNSSFNWNGNDAGCGLGCVLGYTFNVSGSVTIDGLGVFDADADGLNNTHQVGLWASDGTLLASTSVAAGTVGTDASASGAGGYAYADIASLVLGAGDYVVGAFFEVGHTDRVVFNASGIFSNDPGVSFLGGAWINAGAFVFPTNPGGSDRYFGPGIRAASAVPAPGTLALFGIGLFALGMVRRRNNS